MQTKEGTKTSEFWVTIIPAIAGALEAQSNPDKAQLLIICATVLCGLYIVSRTFVKCNLKHVDEEETK
jgi:hypothetical protein